MRLYAGNPVPFIFMVVTLHVQGIAIGLQEASHGMMSLFLAVIVHKSIMSFSLGLNLAKANLSFKTFLISILMFASAR